MSRNKLWTSAITLVLTMSVGYGAAVVAEVPPNAEEMWKIIQQQQKTIDGLKARLDSTEQKVVVTEEKVAANTVAVEEVEESSGSFLGEDTTLGGYGELHYNHLDGKDNAIDLHRFVLFFGHEFADNWRFFSELEVEHSISGEGKKGEVELEQAYLEYDINPNNHVRAGLYLVPVGIMNETHEPPTFYGVERNSVEKNIIPATWWEAGFGLSGELTPGWKYDVMLSSGLKTSAGSSYKIRSGRQKVSKATAEDGAITGRIRYTGIPGLELGLSGQHQQDLTQDEGISASMLEAHVVYERDGFGLRALYASWWLDDGPALTGPAAIGADRQTGFYVEPSYKFRVASYGQIGVFARYQEWNNKAGGNGDDNEQYDIGVNYWPVDDVVFKFDYQFQNDQAGDHDGFNLGIGYQF